MNSFKMRILAFSGVITILSGGGVSVFFHEVYRRDRLSSIFEMERLKIAHGATHLENLLNLAQGINLDRVQDTRSLLFVAEKSEVAIGPELKNQFLFTRAKGNPLSSAEITHLLLPEEAGSAWGPPEPYEILASPLRSMTPYLTAKVSLSDRPRIVGITLEGFQDSTNNTLFLLNSAGAVLWSSDGIPFLKQALDDVGLDSVARRIQSIRVGETPFGAIVNDWIKSPNASNSSVREVGHSGLLSLGRVNLSSTAPNYWILGSLAFEPALFSPLRYALVQAVLFCLGFFSICLLIGRYLSRTLSRPLLRLEDAAIKIGSGELQESAFSHLRSNIEELRVVERAFLVMREKIKELLEATEIKATLEAELLLTQQVQTLLLPNRAVKERGFKIFYSTRTASLCGGDWWGYLILPRPSHPNQTPLLLVLLGDVTGHGAHAALITGVIQGAFSRIKQDLLAREHTGDQTPDLDLEKLLHSLNQVLFETAGTKLNMTLIACLWDASAGILHTANAAHISPYWVAQNSTAQNVTYFGNSGTPLGVEPKDATFQNMKYEIRTPGKLVLFTDGLIEAQEPFQENPFDKKALRTSIQNGASLPGELMLKKILQIRESNRRQALQKLGSSVNIEKGLEESDDVTLLVLELTPEVSH